MARSLWKGSLAFGLVNIPIELHAAVRDHRPRFRLLHAKDQSPISFERVCVHEGRPVAWGDLVKGYEYRKGQFVTLTKEDFRAAALEKTRRIDILDFVTASEIDDRFFETPYYLLPAGGGEHAYAVLREALRESERIGVAKFILRETQHLAAVEVIDQALVLTLLRFADELVSTEQFSLPSHGTLKKNELEMAKTLVGHLAGKWQPDKYTDDYRDNLMRIIQAKAKGKKITLEEKEVPRQGEVVNLMERLRQSLANTKTGRSTGTTRASASSRKASRGGRKQKKARAA
jgi:DNA end-binding protein Ku